MWILIAREPRPDAPGWTGRRWLAAIDAVVWPGMWVLLFRREAELAGVVGAFATAVALLFALTRLYRGVWVNHRYWFTTWRWGRVAAVLMAIGALLKVTMPA